MRTHSLSNEFSVAALCIAISACTGTLGNDGSGGSAPGSGMSVSGAAAVGGSSGASPAPMTPEQCVGAPFDVGVTPLRRLSRDEYNLTAAALLGDVGAPATDFLPDAQVGPFPSNSGIAVPEAQVDKYASAAEALATKSVKSLGTLVPCSKDGLIDAACARSFIQSFGARAFRRPLDGGELDRYQALFDMGATGGTAAEGIWLVLLAVFQSPHFLYHVEQPDAAGAVKLSEYELAARISYFITGAPPDAELGLAAEQNQVSTDPGLHARRLLGTKGARASIERLHDYLLGVDRAEQLRKDAAVAPEFTPELAMAMKAEVGRFAAHVVFDGDHTLRSLLTGSFSVLEPALAPVYGLAPEASNGFVQLSNRSGILTLPAVMATYAHADQTSPVKRGVFVRTKLLCQTLPAPPNNANINPPSPDPSLSTRDRFAAHRKDALCAGCHTLLDPLGFAFEAYDAVGKYRTLDGTFPVDDSAELNGAPDSVAGPFKGVSALATKLLDSPELASCISRQWSTFALARPVTERDFCQVLGIEQRFAESGGDLQNLAISIVASQAFAYRRAQ